MQHESPTFAGRLPADPPPLFVKLLLIQSWLAMNLLVPLNTGATPQHGITAA
jgi:hypothetical protein